MGAKTIQQILLAFLGSVIGAVLADEIGLPARGIAAGFVLGALAAFALSP